MNNTLEDKLIQLAIEEDLGKGDITSLACIPSESTDKTLLLAKEPGMLAGIRVALKVFRIIDPAIVVEYHNKDGYVMVPGDVVLRAGGPSRSLLQAERLALNFIQRMSGIATTARLYVDKLQGLHTKVLDTRKTSPGLRHFEKEAVRIGGAFNHRMGLYDMILIKDNHIDMAGGIEMAIDRVHRYFKDQRIELPVEIEAGNLKDVEKILSHGGVTRIMLDNFSPEDTLQAVRKINGSFETESSGRITLDNIRDYALCGVDFISVGALTHHIKSLDLSLKTI